MSSSQQLLVIWGAAGHALVVADIVRLQGVFRIVGFLDDINPDRRGVEFCGASILGGKDQLGPLLDQGIRHILLGFGNPAMRHELAEYLQVKGFSLPVAIHPRAVVADDVVLGPGSVVAAGAVINPGTRTGSSVIINTSASVDHECIIGDAANINPGVHLGGRVFVGEGVQVGIGATLIDHVHIGARAVIGAGAVVVGDIPDGVVAYGVPAKIIRRVDR